MTQYTVDVWVEVMDSYQVEADSEAEARQRAAELAAEEHFVSPGDVSTQVI